MDLFEFKLSSEVSFEEIHRIDFSEYSMNHEFVNMKSRSMRHKEVNIQR